MRIIHLVPGSGGTFYCQNCLRDLALVSQQREMGHDATITPLYLPLLEGARATADVPVFYGAISLYLRQRFALLRRLPSRLARLLDAQPLLAMAAKRAGSTRARGLEEMTLSMLLGEDGNQAAELDHLMCWIKDEEADVVHLSNALLLGLARRLKRELGVPIICTLQDEDQWIEPMTPPWPELIWRTMSERAREIDVFIAVSHAFGARMTEKMQLPEDQVRVVWLGIDPAPYRPAPMNFDPPVLGYLSRMCESLGLGHLVEAFVRLKSEPGLEDLRLSIAGGHTGDDTAFLSGLRRDLKRAGLLGAVDFVDGLALQDRVDFLSGLSVLSVPIPAGEAFGAFQLEALAAGVPLVQPEVGAFPEIIEATGGGIIYPAGDCEAHCKALKTLLLDPERARAMGRTGRERIRQTFTMERMAREIVEGYRSALT